MGTHWEVIANSEERMDESKTVTIAPFTHADSRIMQTAF